MVDVELIESGDRNIALSQVISSGYIIRYDYNMRKDIDYIVFFFFKQKTAYEI